jgi:predicted nucleic acid-binding protein
MTAEVFVDTNVLLYTIDEDPASGWKRQRAQQLLLSERWGWSVQVAAEFFVNATSPKRQFRLAAADAGALVETWFGASTRPPSRSPVLLGDRLLARVDPQPFKLLEPPVPQRVR